MAQTATVVPKGQSGGKGGKKGTSRAKGSSRKKAPEPPPPAEDLVQYHVTEEEFKGWPILQFWADGNRGRFADLQLGVKKLKVVMAICHDEDLLSEIQDFIETHEKKKD